MMNIILIGNELETPCLMTTSCAFSNTHDTRYEFFFYGVFPNKDFA
jgi:hypothetical protein